MKHYTELSFSLYFNRILQWNINENTKLLTNILILPSYANLDKGNILEFSNKFM